MTGAADPTDYDEQMGMTFTQSFTSMAYNVTAVEQSDPVSGVGPAYLLNGLSNTGYWYQVGLSWNWEGTGTYSNYSPGFNLNYEVFDSSGNSTFPTTGGSGVQAFSGQVNQGDTVLLNLYFSSTYGVVMFAKDYNTGATSSQTYSAEGASSFVGDSSGTANTNGFFTGLMTEWYHSSSFYGNIYSVAYSNPHFALSSAWMWIDEFTCPNIDCSGSTVLFNDATQAPVSYSNPTQLQPFSSNGATEYSDGYKFITGSAGFSTLTMAYSLSGGGVPLHPPVIEYVSQGVTRTSTLSQGQNVFVVDQGSSWSVSSQLSSSSADERWVTNTATLGVATTSETVSLDYFHQYLVSFQPEITGGGTGYGSPSMTYVSYGSSVSAVASSQVWADAGSVYTFSNPLPGSSQSERWDASSASGDVSSAGPISVVYSHQFSFLVSYSVSGGAPTESPRFQGSQFGQQAGFPVTSAPTRHWLDSGTTWSFSRAVNGTLNGERWVVASAASGTVSSSASLSPEYLHQYYLNLTTNEAAGGGVPDSGWHNASQLIALSANATAGWKLEQWVGSGPGAYSGSSSSATISMAGPASEEAVFYPGFTINVAGSGVVSYSSGAILGTTKVPLTLFVAPGSSVQLVSSPSSFLYQFEGWKGALNTSDSLSLVTVSSPATIQASFGYNYVVIGLITAVAIAVAVGLLTVVRSGRGRGQKPEKRPDTTHRAESPSKPPGVA